MYQIIFKKRTVTHMIVGGLTIILLGVVWVGKANSCKISAGKGTATLGMTGDISIPVDLSLQSGEHVASVQLDVGFDAKSLKVDKVSIGSSAQKAEKEVEFSVSSDKVRIIIYGMNQNLINEGRIANLIFKLANSATAEECTLKLNNVVSCDEWAALVASATSDGSIIIIGEGLFKDLSQLKVYPNPFKPSLGHNSVLFMNLPELDSIKIFTFTGELVTEIKEQIGIRSEWNGKNDNGKEVASGLYIYSVTSEKGEKKTGKIAVVK